MSHQFETGQEKFWAGKFGNEYNMRNSGDALIESNEALFSKMLAHCPRTGSMIEFGANIGLNLQAIHRVNPNMALHAIEINAMAINELEKWGGAEYVHHGYILDFHSPDTWDVALIKGVLNHINPEFLPRVYQALYRASNQYIVLVEYYNPTLVEVLYRGQSGKLFKRDFAGEMLDMFPSLQVIDYGFAWHRDPEFPQDDLTWFVLEKTSKATEIFGITSRPKSDYCDNRYF